MKIDRTGNTTRNLKWGITSNIIALLMPFATRTILLRTLGSEYLGLSSLFASILQVLNLAELGLSSAIIYGLYKPIADDDTNTICAYLHFYRNAYRIIGIIITVCGLILLPFVPKLIKGSVPEDINVYWLYLLYLANTSISYFLFAYKSTLLLAHHRTDIQSNIAIGVNVFKYLVQILALLLVKNYYAFIIALPICTIINNLVTSYVTDRKFPNYRCKGKLPAEKSKQIFTHIKGLVVTKMCAVLRDSADSIIISAFLGLNDVTMYSNYFYILSSVHAFMTVVTGSMRAGIGNSIVKESTDKNYADLKKFSFFYSCIGVVCAACMLCLYQPFMRFWAGEKLTYPFFSMILFVIYFYLLCSMDIRNVYIEASGLWWQFRTHAIVETIMNLVLNVLLGKFFGINGIMIATLFTFSLINIVYGSKVLIKNAFPDKKVGDYFKLFVWNTVCTIISCICCYGACWVLPFNNDLLIIVFRGVIAVILSIGIYSLLNLKTPYLKDAVNLTRTIVKTRRKT